MRTQRRVGTKPELELRRILHARGLRYRVAYPVPGAPRRTIDIAFPRQRLAVFIDGCYWHRCPVHHIPAKNNADWWATKLQTNVDRDRATDRLLADAGWKVLRAWEHEDPAEIAGTIEAVVRAAP